MTNDPGTRGPEPDGCSGGQDELVERLRRGLRDAVDEVRPAPGSLDRLRAAIPARRRQRRAAMLGAAGLAAVLVIAAPAVRDAVGGGEPVSSAVGNESPSSAFADSTAPVPGAGRGATTGGPEPADPSGRAETRRTEGPATASVSAGTASASGPRKDGGEPPVVPTASPTATSAPSPTVPPVAACQAIELDQVDGSLGAIGSGGIAYGAVEVRNTAREECLVSGPGVVVVASAPGNPVVQVTVVPKAPGDPAAGLPDVAASTDGLVLRPGASYEFQFAWRPQPPAEGGSCTPDGPPAPVPALGYTLMAGDYQIAKVALTASCGGTLYRTDVYRPGDYPRAG